MPYVPFGGSNTNKPVKRGGYVPFGGNSAAATPAALTEQAQPQQKYTGLLGVAQKFINSPIYKKALPVAKLGTSILGGLGNFIAGQQEKRKNLAILGGKDFFSKIGKGDSLTPEEQNTLKSSFSDVAMDMFPFGGLEQKGANIVSRFLPKQVLKNEVASVADDAAKLANTSVDAIKAPRQIISIEKDIARRQAKLDQLLSITNKKPRVTAQIEKQKTILDDLLGKKEKLQKIDPGLNITAWKDRPEFSLYRETFERNLEAVAGKDAGKLKQLISNPIRENETSRISFLNNIRQEIRKTVVEGFGIKVGTKEDKLIQRFGEGNITLEQLKNETKKWDAVQQSADLFRKKYDELLNKVNGERTKYGYDPIPQRKDYFRHFQELSNSFDVIGMLLNKKNELPTAIAGMTDIFKPNKPFSTAELQRKGGKYTESAIKGMDNYLDSISKQIYHLDSVQRVRGLEKLLRTTAERSPEMQLQNFVETVGQYGNILAGKKTKIDAAFQNAFGRKIFEVANKISKRFGSSVIVGNVSSALTNFIPFTQAAATTSKPSLLRGIATTLFSAFSETFAKVGSEQSKFLIRRFPEQHIDPTKLQKASDFAFWFFNTVDKFAAKSIVSGKYYEAVKKGLPTKEAMNFADEYAVRLLADRSVGQLPNMMSSQSLKAITQFQTEINNAFSFLTKDMPRLSGGSKTKFASMFGQFMVYSYMLNNAFEGVTGRRPTMDPINYALTLVGASEEGKNKSLATRTGDVVEQIAGNLPFVGGITSGRIPLTEAVPDVLGMLKGRVQPVEELKKFATLAIPFGGGQIKKTLEGTAAYNRGYSKTPSGDARFAIDQSPQNFLRSLLFGQYAVPEARDYFNNEQRPLSEKQTQTLSNLENPQRVRYYKDILRQRKEEKQKKEMLDRLLNRKK